MNYSLFAGLVFTTQEIVMYCVAAFLIASLALSIVILVVGYILKRLLPTKHLRAPKLIQSIIIAAIIVALGVISFGVIPTMIEDQRWLDKQEQCAKEVGYASPADDNNFETATNDSQVAYQACLNNR